MALNRNQFFTSKSNSYRINFFLMQRETIGSMKKENTHLQEQIRLLQTMTDVKFTIIRGHKLSPEDQKGK